MTKKSNYNDEFELDDIEHEYEGKYRDRRYRKEKEIDKKKKWDRESFYDRNNDYDERR